MSEQQKQNSPLETKHLAPFYVEALYIQTGKQCKKRHNVFQVFTVYIQHFCCHLNIDTHWYPSFSPLQFTDCQKKGWEQVWTFLSGAAAPHKSQDLQIFAPQSEHVNMMCCVCLWNYSSQTIIQPASSDKYCQQRNYYPSKAPLLLSCARPRVKSDPLRSNPDTLLSNPGPPGFLFSSSHFLYLQIWCPLLRLRQLLHCSQFV